MKYFCNIFHSVLSHHAILLLSLTGCINHIHNKSNCCGETAHTVVLYEKQHLDWNQTGATIT